MCQQDNPFSFLFLLPFEGRILRKSSKLSDSLSIDNRALSSKDKKKQYNVKWAKNAGDFKWDPSTYWDHGALETDWHWLQDQREGEVMQVARPSQLTHFPHPLFTVHSKPSQRFYREWPRRWVSINFQYKSNLSYLFSLFNCNFSVCQIINSWKGEGGCKYTNRAWQCDAVVEMLGLNVEWMEQGTDHAKDENYNTLCCPSLMGA